MRWPGMVGFVFVFLLGCTAKEETKLSPVQGCVYYKGEPVRGGTIVFTPDTESGCTGVQAWSRIGSDGRYQLVSEGRLGASLGWHRITISGLPTHPLPSRYRDPDSSGQRFEVRADRVNTCDLHLD